MRPLNDVRIAVVGIGGLGSPTVLSLLQSGIRHLKLVDRDIVSRTDLHRQILYSTQDVGKPKVEAAVERLKEIDDELDLIGIPEPITPENVDEIVKDVEIVIDGLDNMRTRYLLNRACVKFGKNYIFASAVEMFGNVSTIIPGKTPCLECFYGGLNDSQLPRCGVVGVHPSVLGVVSNIAVSEAISILKGKEPKLAGKLLFIDLREPSFDMVQLSKNPECRVCEKGLLTFDELTEPIEESCARDGSGTFFINKKAHVDFAKVEKTVKEFGWSTIKRTKSSITIKIENGLEATLLSSGSMVFKVGRFSTSIPSLKDRLLKIHKILTE